MTYYTRFVRHRGRHSEHGGIASVTGPEGIINIGVAKAGNLGRKHLIAPLLSWMKTEILQEEHFAGFERLGAIGHPPVTSSV